jgi:methyl-accepting chemotaxis protein
VAEANAVAVQATDTLSLVVKILVSLFLGALTIGILISLTITRSICRPLDTVIGTIGRIADGDLTIRLPDESRNETGMLAAAVNRMADSMNGMLTALARASTNLASASSQLLAQTEQTALGAEEVAAQSEASATASEQMAATSHDIAKSCTRAAESSTRANDRASSSFEIIRRTVEGMHRTAEKVRHSSENVAALGARSDQIGQIATTIEDIADQTNLLALNAAIEAARAGEQGRGFAVVADEVRALAERTAKATKGISDMILSIQQETVSAVKAMDEGVVEVSNGTEGATQSAKALEEIMEEIQTVSQQIGQIAVASEQQSATSGEISNNVHHITGVIEVSSRGAEETAVAARALSQLAEELQGMVGRFKLAD